MTKSDVFIPLFQLFKQNGQLARVFLTLLDTELKRSDAISGWNPSLVRPGRAEPKGIEWGRMEPSGADRETGEGDKRAIFPVGRHVPTGGRKKLAQVIHWNCKRKRWSSLPMLFRLADTGSCKDQLR